MNKRKFTGFTFLVFMAISVYGQDYEFAKEGVIPQLNSHRFVGNQSLDNPFTKSMFELFFGYGNSAPMSTGEFAVGDTTIELSLGNLVYVSTGAKLNLQLKDWLSYNFRFGYSARIGSEPIGLIANGIQSYSFFHNGWRIRIFENNGHYLSANLGVDNSAGVVLDLENYFSDIINGVPSPQISKTYYTLRGIFEVNYAWGINDILGLIFNGGLHYGDLYLTGTTGLSNKVGTGIDLNLYPKTNIPLGFNLAYTFSGSESFEMPVSGSKYSARLAYTRSNSYIISLDATSNTVSYSAGTPSNGTLPQASVLTVLLNLVMFL